jgi:hypothetical protein
VLQKLKNIVNKIASNFTALKKQNKIEWRYWKEKYIRCPFKLDLFGDVLDFP